MGYLIRIAIRVAIDEEYKILQNPNVTLLHTGNQYDR